VRPALLARAGPQGRLVLPGPQVLLVRPAQPPLPVQRVNAGWLAQSVPRVQPDPQARSVPPARLASAVCRVNPGRPVPQGRQAIAVLPGRPARRGQPVP
jgi:hypothetical protein